MDNIVAAVYYLKLGQGKFEIEKVGFDDYGNRYIVIISHVPYPTVNWWDYWKIYTGGTVLEQIDAG